MREQHFFFVPDAAAKTELPEDEAKHALRVLRVHAGDEFPDNLVVFRLKRMHRADRHDEREAFRRFRFGRDVDVEARHERGVVNLFMVRDGVRTLRESRDLDALQRDVKSLGARGTLERKFDVDAATRLDRERVDRDRHCSDGALNSASGP